jgi:mannose-6-phosphate isomerase-like protein (cupin superfamily)
MMVHRGREYGLVLSGRIGAMVGFESYGLGPGDSIVFDAHSPHRFWTIGDEPAIVVWTIIGRAGETRNAFG